MPDYAVPAPDDEPWMHDPIVGEELDIQFVDQQNHASQGRPYAMPAPDDEPWRHDPIVGDALDIQFTDAPSAHRSIFGKILHYMGQHPEHWETLGPAGIGPAAMGYLLTRDAGPNPVQREAHGFIQAGEAGYEASVTGLVTRGMLPEVVLDPHHAKWFEKLASGIGQLAGDFPAMIGGGALAGFAGIESGPGAVVASGAGAMAVPAAIRSALIQAYSKGEVASVSDFLDRTAIVAKQTGTDALVGGLTGGAGYAAGKIISPFASSLVARGLIGDSAARLGTAAARTGAEYGTIVFSPALLQGRMPEPPEFIDAALLLAGVKGVHIATAGLANLYARTGVRPVEAVADAKVDPTIAEDLAKPEAATEVPRAYQPLAAEMAAADAFPGAKAQTVLDHPFADIPETKQPHQMNLKYIEGPEDLRALQTRMSDVYREEIDAARGGTQGWAETEAKAARQVADMTGRDLVKVMAGRQPGDTANAVQLKIQGDILMQATVEAGAAIKAVKDAGLDATDAMRADALEAIHKAAMVQADITGASAELGRALQYLQRIKELRAQGEGIAKLVDMYGNDPRALLEMASAVDTPEGLAKFAQLANRATKWDMFVEAYKAALVSGPITQMANILGNGTMMAVRPAVDIVAAAIGRATNAKERVLAAEPLARIAGNLQGVADGLRIAKGILREEPLGGKAEQRITAIPGKTGSVIRTPFRTLGAADALFRVMIERGEAHALATREAIREGFNPHTREFRERVVELATNPTEAMTEAIRVAGERGTFNTPLGETSRAVSTLVKRAHLEPLMPFIATPVNVFKEMARLSPAAPMLKEWRADVAAGGTLKAKAIAEMSLGYGVSALTMSLAKSGLISGSGDPDLGKRRTAQAAGWQPYSVKIGNTWYSFQRIQPLGTLMGMAADVAESWDYLTEGEGDKALHTLGIAFANAITNQTFLQGLSNVVGALSEPTRRMPKLIQSTATAVIPAALSQTAQIIDPYQREITSILDAAAYRIPGLRETLQPQRDLFGEPVPSQERVAGIIPVATRAESTDKVRTEAARLGISSPQTPASIQLPSAGQRDIGKVDLTPEQRDVFGDVSGHMAYNVLSGLVNAPYWDSMPDMEQRQAFDLVLNQARMFGHAAALSNEQRQEESRRIIGQLAERMKPKN